MYIGIKKIYIIKISTVIANWKNIYYLVQFEINKKKLQS